MTFTTLAVFTFILTGFTLLPLSRYQKWWVRVWDFPRLQIAGAILILIFAQFAFLSLSEISTWVLTGINFICFFYHAWWIFPFTLLFPTEVQQTTQTDKSNSIKILTANVLTPNRNYEAFLDIIRDYRPDLFVTLESNIIWQNHLDKLSKDYVYAVRCPKNNLYGMHVYSMLPLTNTTVKYLVEPDIPSIHTEIVLPSGQQIQLYFVHPTPPVPGENVRSAERDAELVIIGRIAAEKEDPVIVTGDLNDVAWSETTRLFRKISGLLDPRVGRGMFNTYHADYWFIRWPLDHFFHSSHFTLASLERLPGFDSDHFPIQIELTYQPDKEREQQGLQADTEDEKEAVEKMETVESEH